MRYVRYLLLGFGLTLLLLCLLLGSLAFYYRAALVRLAVDRLEARTGLTFVSAHINVNFGTYLVVRFDQPELLDQGRPIGRLKTLTLLFGYDRLLSRSGLPIHAAVLDSPELHLPASLEKPPLPSRLDAASAELLRQYLRLLSSVTRRLEVIGGTVLGADDAPLLERVNFEAYRKLLRRNAWQLKFDAAWAGAQLKGMRFGGMFNLSAGTSTPGRPIAQGEFWFWNGALDSIPLPGDFHAEGRFQGSFGLVLRDDGTATADASIKVTGAGLAGGQLIAPTEPTDFVVDSMLEASPERLVLRKIELWQGRDIVLAGDGYLGQPFSQNSAVGFRLGGLTVNVSQLRKGVSLLRGLPGWMHTYADRLTSGDFLINDLALDSTLADLKFTAFGLLKELRLDANLHAVGFALPPELKLPAVDRLEAAVLMRDGLLTISQTQARFRDSNLTEATVRADLSRGLEGASYSARLKGDLNLGSLYSPATSLTGAAGTSLRNRIERLDGTAAFELETRGRLSNTGLDLPTDYRATLEPRRVEVALRVGGPAFSLIGGKAIFTPGLASLDNLTATPGSGKAMFSGKLRFHKASVKAEDLTATINDLPVEQWLPLILSPEDLSARGAISGTLVANTDPIQPARYLLRGNFRMGPGQIQLGFLRSPVITRQAIVKLAGGGAQLSIPGAMLEGSGLNLTLGVAELENPRMRIDAVAENLDLEAMKFVRLPWSPKGKISFFGKSRAFGHIEARRAHIAKLPITDLKFDFTRDEEWRVFNCAGRVFNGTVSMDLTGRDRDDWVRIKSRMADVDLGPLIAMSDGTTPPQIVGKLDADADFLADTNNDFFETLGGAFSFAAKHGTLRKFKLLSRVLNTLDLGQWLTAKIPDPRINGVPFDTLTASFTGRDGLFHTDELLLNGPVMTMSATGNVNIARSTLDLQLGVRPFSTVERVVKEIPLLGRGIATNQSGILAAYFRIRGPMRDPAVTPAPVTSIAEIIKKTLGLPLNIIRPGTVK